MPVDIPSIVWARARMESWLSPAGFPLMAMKSADRYALAVLDAAQAIGDPTGIGRCNGACDCPYGQLRKLLEGGDV